MAINIQHETVIILDFGSQYTQLIARRVREAGVYCEILPFNTSAQKIASRRPKGVILSGSPASVYQENAPRPPDALQESIDCPLLGICYGLQVVAFDMGGEVKPSPKNLIIGIKTRYDKTPPAIIIEEIYGPMI